MVRNFLSPEIFVRPPERSSPTTGRSRLLSAILVLPVPNFVDGIVDVAHQLFQLAFQVSHLLKNAETLADFPRGRYLITSSEQTDCSQG